MPSFVTTIALLQVVVVIAEPNTTTPLSICVPFGECEPCPPDALHEPFCQPFGNRRLMHCSLNNQTITSTVAPTTPSQPSIQGELPAWQSCGRIVARERADFYEFLACNLLFAIVALSIALVRSRTVEARQARRLVARIGLTRGPMMDAR
ncbi:hypothetical protein L210DRAFT_3613776 [Boletus edulis BED1]|uniref:Uncharacterized protein n=1 Tax=Boletus edulis BED1 TaxID=1328754 RepID=A0AAD4GBJ1_BOLED|nr:hypothetical protein L210DRAFT_3613776 [Boletus edulis BED1]